MASCDHLAGMFSALGGPVRVRIVQLLLRAGSQGLGVNAIKGKVRIPGSTLSHHLDRLKRHDVLTVERQGTNLRYSVNPKALDQLAEFLTSKDRAVPPDILQPPRGTAARAQVH